MKIDISKNRLTTCCSMTDGVIDKNFSSKFLYLETKFGIYNTSWKRKM